MNIECQHCGSDRYQDTPWNSVYICLSCDKYFESDEYELEELRRQRKYQRERDLEDDWD